MVGTRLRISDVETCNTGCFLWVSCMFEPILPIDNNPGGGCYLFLYSVKDPPVISRKILQKWLLWAKPESSAIFSIV